MKQLFFLLISSVMHAWLLKCHFPLRCLTCSLLFNLDILPLFISLRGNFQNGHKGRSCPFVSDLVRLISLREGVHREKGLFLKNGLQVFWLVKFLKEVNFGLLRLTISYRSKCCCGDSLKFMNIGKRR